MERFDLYTELCNREFVQTYVRHKVSFERTMNIEMYNKMFFLNRNECFKCEHIKQ